MLSIGFVYDQPPQSPVLPDEVASEYEDQETIDWILSALESLGSVITIPWSQDAVAVLANRRPDVVFNITEASGSRNRESLVPAICESLSIAYTGSDAVALGISLDKYLTKTIAASAGIDTPPAVLAYPGWSPEQVRSAAGNLSFPLIVKPNTGGSSMGIRNDSKVDDPSSLVKAVEAGLDSFREPMLIEEFVTGRELTAGILDRPKGRTLPVAEIIVPVDSAAQDESTERASDFYSIEKKSRHQKKVICPVELPESIEAVSVNNSVAIFDLLACFDMARVDYRIDSAGRPQFIEINPLPGLSPYYSIFPMQARAAGIGGEEMMAILVENAVRRGNKGVRNE